MPELRSEYIFTMWAEIGTPQRIGDTPLGRRVIWPVTGGHFEGPAMKGAVLPGGGDWLLVRTDGAFQLDVRATMKTHDDHLVFFAHRGLIKVDPDYVQQFSTGEVVDPSHVYYRAAPVFEVWPGPYEWLNRTVTVGVGARSGSTIIWEIFKVL